jgi:putative redox protein
MKNTATLTWVDGMQFVAGSGTGHAIVIDGDEEVGGHNTGPRPMELLLMGLLSCTAMDVLSVLQKKRQKVTALNLYAEGQRAEEHPRRYTQIHVTYVACGDVEEAALARAIQLSEERYCAAMATIRPAVQLSSSFRVERSGAGREQEEGA